MSCTKFPLLFLFISLSIKAQISTICLDCHGDETLSYSQNGKTVSLYVDSTKFYFSIHGDLDCVDCHEKYDPNNLPHRSGKNKRKVVCEQCHDTEIYQKSIHGLKQINCYDCHSKHAIESAESLKKNEVKVCNSCHNQPAVKGYFKSIHYKKFLEGGKSPVCTDCHNNSAHEIKLAEFTESELHELCANCHENIVKQYEKSLHGQALVRGKYLAPNCITCHNQHKIQSHKNPESRTYKMNIPNLCGKCHKDGTRVSELKDISQKHILKNYSQSIHGDGLFRRGLIVTAVCTDCHTSHNVLPHQNPNSTINRKNIAKTCTQCHAQIEKVHVKVIEGKLWETEPNKIPACIDCHSPHSVRRVFYEEKYTDDYCMNCHSNKKLEITKNGKKISLYVNLEDHKNSVHKDNQCIKCHTNVQISNSPVCKDSGPVDCSSCHAEIVGNYVTSIHGKLHYNNDPNTPYCIDCHGKHNILSKNNVKSRTFRKNIPMLCADCHREGEKAAKRYKGEEHNIIKNYTMSIHGKGLLKSGLMVTAICIDCHTTHHELPASNIMSTVNRENIPETCGKCHYGIYQQFEFSVHSPEITKTDKKLPSCYDCHESHTIERVDKVDFRQRIINQCGKCHEDVTKTYFNTFHGKVSKLGSVKTARCYDCHGSHNILPPDNPKSTLSYQNVVHTCKKCHPNSNRKFVGYLTHATHHDKSKYPYLYYTYLFMTILLIGTFSFFGIHTLLWLPRALVERKKEKKINKAHNNEKEGNNNE